MILVVVVERFLLLRYFWISDIELDIFFCEVGVSFVVGWVGIECFCFLGVELVFGLIFVLIWVIMVGLVILV